MAQRRVFDVVAETVEDKHQCRFIAAQDAENVFKTAHSLKSSSGSMAAVQLARCYSELEQSARSGRLDAVADQLAAIEREYERATQALRAVAQG